MTLRIIRRERIRQTQPRFGRHILHDSESRRYRFDTAGIPIRAVRHKRHVPVLDQGELGSCCGNAAVGCLGTGPFYATLPTRRLIFPHLDEADAIACYSDATQLDDEPDHYPPTDTGTSGLAVAKVLQQAGLISGYQHTFTITDALKALQVSPLICGTLWLSAMDSPNALGLVSVSGNELGGHEYIVDEYDPERGWVGFTNSWGTGYGVQGRFYMQAEDFAGLLDRDGDVTVFTPLTQPAPQPTPPPAPPVSPDETFARTLHRWLDTQPAYYHQLARDARQWLTAKGL